MFLRLETLQPLHLMGFQVENPVFSMEETSALWRSFRSRMNEIGSGQSIDLYSVQVHDSENPGRISCRWAAAMAGSAVPDGMEELRWEGGLYAVFLYRGGMPGFGAFLRDVFTRKIPALSLLVDDRPHFQLMGEKYNPFSEESEEEVWIPVRVDPGSPDHRLITIASISALLSLGNRMDELRHRMDLALDSGFQLSEVKEIILQVCLYAGFPRSLNGMACLRTLMESRNQRGLRTEDGRIPSPQPEGVSRYQLGWDTLQSLDPEFIHHLKTGLDPVSPELFSMVLEHGYADIFYRDNLDIRHREAAVVAALVAVGNADPQLSFHIKAAMGTGMERNLLKSIILTAAAAAEKNPDPALALLNAI